MRSTLNIVFAVIVLVPLLLLAGLGAKVVRDERLVVEQQVKQLHEERLRDLEGSITQRIGEVELELERLTQLESPGAEALRELMRQHPLVLQAFLLSPAGELIYPAESEELSQGERAFLERTRSIWRGEAMLYEPPPAEDRSGSSGWLSRSSPGGDSVRRLASRRQRGWIAWYWEEGLHLLYWTRTEAGAVIGAEVGRIALLSRIVGSLPELDPGDGRIVLADSKGDSVFQWGQREPRQGERPLARHAIAYPLDTYALAYYGAAGAETFGESLRLGLLASFLAVMLIVLGLAVYFHREQNRALREAKNRVSFVTQVSHELKTPLTNIRLYAELLEDRLDPEDQGSAHHLGVIVSESQRLSRLIGNILTFSKQQKDRLVLRRAPIEVDRVIGSVLEQFRPSFEAKGIVPELAPAAPKPIAADADAVGQILGNLLSNVEKYGASGGALRIESAQDEGWTRVRVFDSGPGVASAHREKIFQPFYRVSDKLSDGVTGTGIGLSIARDLARLHGGELELLPSERGAAFELRLPTDSREETAV